MDTFRSYVNNFSPITDESWKQFEKILTTQKFSAGTVLCQYNTLANKVFYSVSGYARAYALGKDGNEFNIILYPPHRFMGSISALTKRSKANLEVQCLTDCTMIYFDYSEFMKLVDTNNEFCKFYRKALEYYMHKLERSTIRYVTTNATQRFILLKREAPDIEKHITQYHIASHLGITPIQLSRIKKKLNSKH